MLAGMDSPKPNTESVSKKPLPVRVSIVLLLGVQALLVLLLAPGDGGRWQSIILPLLWAFDIVVCVVEYFVGRIRKDRTSGVSVLAAIILAIGSVVVAVAGTYAMDFFDLVLFR